MSTSGFIDFSILNQDVDLEFSNQLLNFFFVVFVYRVANFVMFLSKSNQMIRAAAAFLQLSIP